MTEKNLIKQSEEAKNQTEELVETYDSTKSRIIVHGEVINLDNREEEEEVIKILSPKLTNQEMKDINGWIDRSNGTMELVDKVSEVQHSKTFEWACDWIEQHPGESLREYAESAGVKSFKETLEEVLSN